MPRRIFPAGTVSNTTGLPLRLTFYATSTTGRRETDLWTVDSFNRAVTPIPNGIILTDTTGAYSAFAGPDEIDTLYLNPHTGDVRTQITATGSPYNAGAQNQLGISVPAGWGSFWRTARNAAKAGTGLARVACVGDSVTLGQWTSDFLTKSYPALLAADLQSLYGDGGGGYFSTARTTLQGFTTQGGLASLGGTWIVNVNACDGPAGSVLRAGSTGASATFTVRGSTVEVFVLTGTGTTFGNYQVSIDGGTATSAVSTNTGTSGLSVRTFTGLTSGSHTVTVSTPDANGTTVFFYLCGVSGRNAAGVVVDNYGRGGWPALAFSNLVGQSWTASGTTYGGGSNGAFAPAGKWSGGSARPADLIIYAVGLNDAHYTLTAPDTYIRYVRMFLDDVKSTNNGAQDVLILMPHLGTFDDSTTNYYANYAGRMRGIADAYGAAFVNLWTLGRNSWNYWNSLGYWGSSTTPGASGTDVVHLSDTGYAAVKSVLLPLLTS